MNLLSRIAGRAVDRAIGLPARSEPYLVRHDVTVPMPDGVVLLADHYRPAGPDRPLPVVLIRSPYGRAGLAALVFAAPLARRGFQVFIQSTRGTFGSGGQFRPFTTEREDGLATVAWLRGQPWCDGQVSMTGGSYLGHTQWAVAPYVDPPLRSVSPNITAAKMSATFYAHGAPGLKNALNWTGLIGRQERRGLAGLIPSPRQEARMNRALRKVPLQAADVDVAGAPVAFWRDFIQHAAPGDEFWAVADHDGADLTRLPPVSMVTGWWDLFLPGQLRDYAAIRAAGVAARITVGPWLHGEPGEVKAITQQDVAWLDHHLNGGPPPPGAPVRLFLQQAGTWLGFDDWPPPAAGAAWYLRAAGGLGQEPEPGDAAPGRFVYDPAHPTPSAGGPTLQPPGKQVDNAELEARSDVLTYTGEPLAAGLDLAGPVRARIFVRTGRRYADLFVRICDVDAEGVSRNVTDGIRRLSPQTVPAADVQVGDDGIMAVDLELFPTAYRFRAGHRIRVQVSGGAFPRFARNLGTAEPFGTATAALRCRFEIHHDSRHPAHVHLPVLDPP
jgi:putative CocE/NonD family hydrolase